MLLEYKKTKNISLIFNVKDTKCTYSIDNNVTRFKAILSFTFYSENIHVKVNW